MKVDGGDGKFYDVPELSEDNVFRGPKQFYTLGDPNGLPLITAFGQDNSGMYIDGNNIVINDILDILQRLGLITYELQQVEYDKTNIVITKVSNVLPE